MNKKITLIVFLILCSITVSLGQMASLENKLASPHSTTGVALSVDNVSNINSLTLQIGFDPDVLDFISLSGQTLPGMLATVTGDQINITWYSTTAFTPVGPVCNLEFFYKGGNTDLLFMPGCEISSGTTPVAVGFINGSVGPEPCIPGGATAIIADFSAPVGGLASVPVILSNLPLAGSFTLYIAYNPDLLTFVNIQTGGALAGTIGNLNQDGLLILTWTAPSGSPGGVDINTIPGTFLNLNFEKNFSGDAAIDFAPGSVFTGGAPLTATLPVCFDGGIVSQTATTNTATLGDITGAVPGLVVDMPLGLNIAEPVSAFTLVMNYNGPVLAYTGFTAVDPLATGNVMVSVAGNILTVTYTNAIPAPINSAEFIKLHLKYQGVGEGLVMFTGASVISDNFFMPVNVQYDLSGGTVIPGFYPLHPTVMIGEVNASLFEIVDVPLTIDGAAANPLGAATMFIDYDNQKLSFIGVTDNLYNATVNSAGSQISIAWSDPAGVNLSGEFLKLRFRYNGGGGSSCGAPLEFCNNQFTMELCELATSSAAIVPGNWIDGGINLSQPVPAIAGAANPLVNSTEAYTTDNGMMNYIWTVDGGVINSGQGTSSISVTWGAAGSGSVDIQYHTLSGCYMTYEKAVTILAGPVATNIEGYITYNNTTSPGMNGVEVSLVSSTGSIIGTPFTTINHGGLNGYYQFTNVPQDFYTLQVNYPAPWPGVPAISATDALIVELNTAGLFYPTLSGIRYDGANVTGGSSVNATDALLIKKRIIGEISSFPVGDWVFDNQILNGFTAPVSVYNFQGLSAGDVNGSFSPVVMSKSAPVILVVDNSVQLEKINSKFTYQVKLGQRATFGAMTLFMKYDPSFAEVLSVSSPMTGLQYSINDGVIRIAWSNPDGYSFSDDDVLLNLSVVLKQAVETPKAILEVAAGSEFADPMAEMLGEVKLKMARVAGKTNDITFAVTPNPIVSSGTVAFSVPQDGKVTIEVANMLGAKVITLVDSYYTSGTHTANISASSSGLNSGVWFATMKYLAEGKTTTRVIKFIIK